MALVEAVMKNGYKVRRYKVKGKINDDEEWNILGTSMESIIS